MMEEMKKEFEEYRMDLIAIQGDIITTSYVGLSEPDMGGGSGGNGNVDGEGWPEEPGI